MKPLRILVMGLPGSGKTYFSQKLTEKMGCAYFNADKLRKMSNDWDFSNEGRMRQSRRMKTYSMFEKKNGRMSVCDFICPTKETRDHFNADYVIWINTIIEGRYEDTNKIFENPSKVDYLVTEKNAEKHIDIVIGAINDF